MQLTVCFPVRSDLWIPRESLLELGTEIKQRRGRTVRRGILEDQLEIGVSMEGRLQQAFCCRAWQEKWEYYLGKQGEGLQVVYLIPGRNAPRYFLMQSS